MADAPETSPADEDSGPAYELRPGLASLRSASVSPSGRLAALYGTRADGRPALKIWDVLSQTEISDQSFDAPVVGARFTADGSTLISLTRGPDIQGSVRIAPQ